MGNMKLFYLMEMQSTPFWLSQKYLYFD